MHMQAPLISFNGLIKKEREREHEVGGIQIIGILGGRERSEYEQNTLYICSKFSKNNLEIY